jgi:recombination protein U
LQIGYANRGAALEQLIYVANAQYQAKGLAVIQKVATPWKVVRHGRQIISAFPERKSTVDFVGVAAGRPIAFDAKSTRTETRFPLDNIEQHQFEFLQAWHDQGGIAFILIEFATLDEFYVLPFTDLNEWWVAMYRGGRKSVPYETIRRRCPRVTAGRGVVLDYLQAVV